MQHFNRLDPAEAERLAILMEECGEVIQVCGKILRHGYESKHPDGGPTNEELLERELGDLRFAIFFMCERGDIRDSEIEDFARLKNLKIGKYLHHQSD